MRRTGKLELRLYKNGQMEEQQTNKTGLLTPGSDFSTVLLGDSIAISKLKVFQDHIGKGFCFFMNIGSGAIYISFW